MQRLAFPTTSAWRRLGSDQCFMMLSGCSLTTFLTTRVHDSRSLARKIFLIAALRASGLKHSTAQFHLCWWLNVVTPGSLGPFPPCGDHGWVASPSLFYGWSPSPSPRVVHSRLGVDLIELERYKEAFDKYDQDGSGAAQRKEVRVVWVAIAHILRWWWWWWWWLWWWSWWWGWFHQWACLAYFVNVLLHVFLWTVSAVAAEWHLEFFTLTNIDSVPPLVGFHELMLRPYADDFLYCFSIHDDA